MENTLALSSLNVPRQASQSISEKKASMYFKRSAGCAAPGDSPALGMSPCVFSPACPLNGQRPEHIPLRMKSSQTLCPNLSSLSNGFSFTSGLSCLPFFALRNALQLDPVTFAQDFCLLELRASATISFLYRGPF
jgi:hypothetical protein